MNRGVISIETDYSDSDFKIEWEGVSKARLVGIGRERLVRAGRG